MSFKLNLADRLDYLSHLGPGIEDVFDAFTRPFGEHRVLGPDGAVIPELPPALKAAWARVMESVHDFESVAAAELATISGRKKS